MTVFPRRSLRALVAFSVLVTSLVMLVSLPTAATTENPCAALQQWASMYKGASPSLDDVARFDRGHRIAIFNAVSPAVRAALWQEQLHRFGQRENLTTAQRALIEEAAALTTPQFYAGDSQAVAAYTQFWARAQSAFSTPDDQRVMSDIGSVIPQFNRTKMAFTCDCGRTAWECGGGSCATGTGCQTQQGCGAGGSSPCIGTCN